MQIVLGFVTTNQHKLRETEACLQTLWPEIKVLGVELKVETEEIGNTFEENARIKLQAALSEEESLPKVTHLMAEDSGLIIEALDGLYNLSPFPGIRSDRWLTEEIQQKVLKKVEKNPTYKEKNETILKLMKGKQNRRAWYEACIAYVRVDRAQEIRTISGQVALWISESPHGTEGFGYDPIMIPLELETDKTMAEIPLSQKNRISHRYHALRQLLEQITTDYSEQYAPRAHETG